MNHHTSSDRRFLTFPAIHPCSAVSPAALLTSLSSLAADIDAFGCRQTDNFRTHRRAAREVIRHAAIILAFLDDLRPFPTVLPRSAVLGLSDLHVTLQKLHLILYDCASSGARLWILLNVERIAGEFRVLLRSIATALDVLPLDSMDLSGETKDLVRLLAGQACRVDVRVEPRDELAGRSVRSIFTLFQAGESPDPNDLRRVLNHLKITSWIDCFAEVAFLEEEIFAGEGNAGEAALLWSSMGLMVYSLVVLFDATPNGKRRKVDECFRRQESTVVVEQLNADGLRCPISLELMKDPVTVSTGQTYDRSSILRWLKSGNNSCPVTGEKLASAELIPNSTIRKLVNLYCQENGILISQQGKTRKRDLSKTLSPATPAAVGAIRIAATVLIGKLATGESEKKNIAACEIRMLSKSNIFNRICFVEADAVRWLLRLVSSSDALLQDNAVAALLNLSKHHSGRTDIFEFGGLAPVVQVMKFGHKVEAQQNAAAILFYLSSMEECREAIGEIPEAIPALVELLKNGTYRGKKNAILTVYGLLLFSGNHGKILAAETAAVIADLLEAEEEDLVTDCVGVLAKIAEIPDGTNAILKSCGVGHLVHVLQSSSSTSGREYSISVLLSICQNGGEKAVNLLEKMPMLMPSLYALVSEGSRQASKKARSLLNYMHRFNDQGYSPVLAAVHDPMVHAQ